MEFTSTQSRNTIKHKSPSTTPTRSTHFPRHQIIVVIILWKTVLQKCTAAFAPMTSLPSQPSSEILRPSGTNAPLQPLAENGVPLTYAQGGSS